MTDIAAPNPNLKTWKEVWYTLTGSVSAGSGAGLQQYVRESEVVEVRQGGQQQAEQQLAAYLREHHVPDLLPMADPVEVRGLVHFAGDALQTGDGHHVDERPGGPDVDDHQ